MNSISWRRRDCPLCGSSSISAYPEVQSQVRAEDLSFSELKKYFIGLRKEQIFFSYFRCLICKLLYCPYYFDSEQLQILYSSMPNNFMGDEKSVVSKTQTSYVKWISTRKKSKTIDYLEIGPDVGLVAHAIGQYFDVNQGILVEPNNEVSIELRDNTKNYRAAKITENLTSENNFSFDLAVGIHVFDHILKPKTDLEVLRIMAKSNASLAIVVHNESSLLRKILGSKWPPFCLQHPQLFNPATLKLLLKKSGWNMIEVKRTTNWYTAKHLSRITSEVLGISKKVTNLVPGLQIPVRLGNLISFSHSDLTYKKTVGKHG